MREHVTMTRSRILGLFRKEAHQVKEWVGEGVLEAAPRVAP